MILINRVYIIHTNGANSFVAIKSWWSTPLCGSLMNFFCTYTQSIANRIDKALIEHGIEEWDWQYWKSWGKNTHKLTYPECLLAFVVYTKINLKKKPHTQFALRNSIAQQKFSILCIVFFFFHSNICCHRTFNNGGVLFFVYFALSLCFFFFHIYFSVDSLNADTTTIVTKFYYYCCCCCVSR